MRSIGCGSFSLALITLFTATALGQPSDLAESKARSSAHATKEVTQWYGEPIIATHLASATMILGGFAQHADNAARAMVLAGLVTYALGGPIVHFSTAQPRNGCYSLALRLGATSAGALVGAGVGSATAPDNCKWACGLATLGGAVLGFSAGAITASLIDVTELAYKPQPPKESELERRAQFRAADRQHRDRCARNLVGQLRIEAGLLQADDEHGYGEFGSRSDFHSSSSASGGTVEERLDSQRRNSFR